MNVSVDREEGERVNGRVHKADRESERRKGREEKEQMKAAFTARTEVIKWR